MIAISHMGELFVDIVKTDKRKLEMNTAKLASLAVAALALSASATSFARTDSTKAVGEGKVMPNGERIICKKTAETGSLVKKTKKCYTKSQWDHISEAARKNGEQLQSSHASGTVSN